MIAIPEGFEPPEDPSDPSIDRQYAILKEWAEKQSGPITLRFDEGISAEKVSWEERPGFQMLISQMEPGDHLAVWRLDRIDRGRGRMLHAIEVLTGEKKFCLHSLSELNGQALDLDTIQGLIFAHVYSMVAGMDTARISAATKSQLAYLRDAGRKYFKYPGYGRRFHKVTEGGETVTYVVWDQDECDIIREIKRRRDTGENWNSIGRDLHERQGGRASRDGGKWMTQSAKMKRLNKQPIPTKVKRVYAWYTFLLNCGMNLGEDGAPSGVKAMVNRWGVSPEAVRAAMPNYAAEKAKRALKKATKRHRPEDLNRELQQEEELEGLWKPVKWTMEEYRKKRKHEPEE